jgi:hypothetical protein
MSDDPPRFKQRGVSASRAHPTIQPVAATSSAAAAAATESPPRVGERCHAERPGRWWRNDRAFPESRGELASTAGAVPPHEPEREHHLKRQHHEFARGRSLLGHRALRATARAARFRVRRAAAVRRPRESNHRSGRLVVKEVQISIAGRTREAPRCIWHRALATCDFGR